MAGKRRWLAVLALAAVLFPAGAAWAAQPADEEDLEERVVTVDVENGTLADVMHSLMAQGVNVAGVDLAQITGISVHARGVTVQGLADVLDTMLADSPPHYRTFEILENVLVVSYQPPEPPAPAVPPVQLGPEGPAGVGEDPMEQGVIEQGVIEPVVVEPVVAEPAQNDPPAATPEPKATAPAADKPPPPPAAAPAATPPAVPAPAVPLPAPPPEAPAVKDDGA